MRLTLVMVVFGLLFLPGMLIWLAVFQLRRTLAGAKDRRVGALGTILLVAVAGLAVLFLIKLPFHGVLALYLRAMIVAPVVGWYWAKVICEKTARDLRSRWDSLLGGGGIGAKIPEAVPKSSAAGSAEQLRQSLVKLAAEDQSNIVFYAGPKGILGMGTRWGSWQLAEELVPKEAGKEIHGFRSWDVIRAVQDRLLLLERGPLHTGGFPTPSIRNWVVSPIGEGAKEVSRPSGQDIDNFQVRQHEIQRICNEQQFSSGNRHYLGIQFTLWDGQLVITMMVTVTVLHETLRIEVTGHALGPVHALFTTKPAPKTREVDKTFRFWEKKTIALPAGRRHRGGAPRRASAADLVPAAARLPGRQDSAARAVRPAARLGRPALAAPLHGRRRDARGDPRAAGGARGGDEGARRARREHRALHQPFAHPQRHGPGRGAEEGGHVRRVRTSYGARLRPASCGCPRGVGAAPWCGRRPA